MLMACFWFNGFLMGLPPKNCLVIFQGLWAVFGFIDAVLLKLNGFN